MQRPRTASLSRRAGALALALSLFAASAAAQSEVWTVDRDTAVIRRVNIASGATISQKGMLLPGFNIAGAEGLARRPSNGDLYVLLNLNSPARMLARVDPVSGACTMVGNTTDTFVSLAFGPNGALYAITDDSGALPETMCTLSIVNGAPTFFTTLGNGDAGEAIGWRADAARMFHGSGTNTRVFESIVMGNQAVTPIPLSGADYGRMRDIVHTAGDEFLVAGENDELYRLTNTGVASFVSSLNHTASGLVPIEETGSTSCFGDSSGGCPCGNSSNNGGGCANSTGSGALLRGLGTAQIGGDTFLLEATFIPDQPGIFFQGSNFIANPPNFGDGLRCCGMNVVRWITVLPEGGCAATNQPAGCGSHIGGPGGSISTLAGLSAGDTRCYQYWYRDPNGSSCGLAFNLSNAVGVTWAP